MSWFYGQIIMIHYTTLNGQIFQWTWYTQPPPSQSYLMAKLITKGYINGWPPTAEPLRDNSVLYSILVQLSICYSSNFLLGLSVVLFNDDHRCQIIPFCQHQWAGNYKNNTPRNHLHKRKVAHWPSSCPKRPMCNYIHPYKEHHNRTCNWHCVTVGTSDQTARKGSRT